MTVEEFAAVDESLLGRVIGGKFTIRECIGVGASGSVYQADQLTLGRTVAVKILRQDLAADPRLVKRFHDEALAAVRRARRVDLVRHRCQPSARLPRRYLGRPPKRVNYSLASFHIRCALSWRPWPKDPAVAHQLLGRMLARMLLLPMPQMRSFVRSSRRRTNA